MRAGIGLLVLLITVVIMLLLYVGLPGVGGKGYLQTVQQGGQKSAAFANQLAGKDPTGNVTFADSIRLKHLDNKYYVAWLKKEGPAELRYGFKVDDQITQVGPFDTRDQSMMGDKDNVILWMSDTYSRNGNITVIRAGETMILPTAEQREKTKDKMPSMTNPLQGLGQ